MAETLKPQGEPRRPHKEFEDNHFHDDDDVAQPPVEEVARLTGAHQPPAHTPRKLPPPPRRFYED